MGVKNGHALLYSIKNLSFSDICVISRYRNTLCYIKNKSRNSKTIIDIDASWLAFQANKSSTPAQFVVSICLLFAREGFEVVVVCDGKTRHHSKRSTIGRSFTNHSNKIELFWMRCIYKALVDKANVVKTVLEKNNIKKEIEILKEKINKLDNKVNKRIIDVGLNFYDALHSAISELIVSDLGAKDGSIRMLISEFQADAVIAYRTNQFLNNITICSDSDQSVLCGVNCLSIKKFTFVNSKKNRKISNFEIFSSDYSNIYNAANTINLPLSSDKIITPNIPLFEKVDDAKLRALMAVGIGCDVYISGVKNIGPKHISGLLDLLRSNNVDCNLFYDKIMELYKNQYKKEKEKETNKTCKEEDLQTFVAMINIYVESYIYEPANIELQANERVSISHQKNIYIYKNSPEKLHPYNLEFGRGDSDILITPTVDCCVDVDWCVGIGKNEHMFLKNEGFLNCFLCNSVCCVICNHNNKDNNQTYCAKCYLPSYCLENNIQETIETETSTSKEEMIQLLSEKGITVLQSVHVSEINEIYDSLKISSNYLYDNSIESTIKIPEQQSNYLLSIQPISKFRFLDGGNFIFKKEHTIEDMVGLMEIMNELVNIKKINADNNQSLNSTYHSILPVLIIKFAEES